MPSGRDSGPDWRWTAAKHCGDVGQRGAAREQFANAERARAGGEARVLRLAETIARGVSARSWRARRPTSAARMGGKAPRSPARPTTRSPHAARARGGPRSEALPRHRANPLLGPRRARNVRARGVCARRDTRSRLRPGRGTSPRAAAPLGVTVATASLAPVATPTGGQSHRVRAGNPRVAEDERRGVRDPRRRCGELMGLKDG